MGMDNTDLEEEQRKRKYIRELEKLQRFQEEERLREENEKLYNQLRENERKLNMMRRGASPQGSPKPLQFGFENSGGLGPGQGNRPQKRVPSPPSTGAEAPQLLGEGRLPSRGTPAKRQVQYQVKKKTRSSPAKGQAVSSKNAGPVSKSGTAAKTEAVKRSPSFKGEGIKKQRTSVSRGKAAPEKRVRQRSPRKKKGGCLGLFLSLFFVVFVFGFGLYFALHYFKKEVGYYTVAIFGVDSRDGNVDQGTLADVNLIAHLNRETGNVQLISVYRDLYSLIDDGGTYRKLNQAYNQGGAEQAVATLERNLDIEIDDYITFNWKSVVDAINILGGVDVEITEPEFKYINSFITFTVEATGVGSVHLEHPGMNHLDGVQAVAYARLRLMDTDFNRTERQRKVVSLAFEKAKHADFGTLNNILVSVLPQTKTSVTLDDVIPLAKGIHKYSIGETTGFPFDKEAKKMGKSDYVVPVTLRTNVIALHTLMYGDKEGYTYTPSATVNAISKHIIEMSGIGADKEAASFKTGVQPETKGESSTHASKESKSGDSKEEGSTQSQESQEDRGPSPREPLEEHQEDLETKTTQ